MFLLGAIDDAIIPVLAIAGGLVVGVVAIISSTIKRTRIAQAREESRREIAAYVAEGTMSAEDGAKLLEAGKSSFEKIVNG
ncbi:MAG: hypothetical protein ACT4PL_13015 [Phycisphaerales bacterium]